ncbi:MAG: PD-(D/E)XK nuclease family protein, partial [Bacteroidota bacterium]|nr:PD-(D/E)XK nuclease family protein [Bacteroidota bacterium]
NDIPQAIDDLEFNGILYDKPLTRQELRRIIDERMKSKQVADWFSPRWKVFNECTILAFDESEGRVQEHRPDRVIYDDNQMVVIDFKTGAEHEAHHDQVREYMDLLRNMGYQNVSGYLWYIRTNRVTAV